MMNKLDVQAAKERCEAATAQWTREERSEWTKGYPYSAKFTQGVVYQLSAALEALEEVQQELKAIKVYGDRFVDWHALCVPNGACGEAEPGGPPCRSPRYGSLAILGESE
jgi:hypothetical protein